MPTERERKLVDICFEIGLTIHENSYLKNLPQDKVAGWIAEQLEKTGFKTVPMGASWGYLIDTNETGKER